MIPDVPREKLLEAISYFKNELSNTPQFANWEQNGNYEHAVLYEEERYPVKEIIRQATNYSNFSGGEADLYMRRKGFIVIKLRQAGTASPTTTSLIPDGLNDTYTDLQEAFEYILERYTEATGDSTIKQMVENAFRWVTNQLQQRPELQRWSTLEIEWSIGKGDIAHVPWIAIRDRRIAPNIKAGVYCVYLFKADLSGLYLTINQGVGLSATKNPNKSILADLQAKAKHCRVHFNGLAEQGFLLDDKINLNDAGRTGRSYEAATITYKYYNRAAIPPESQLLQDLVAALETYEKYVPVALGEPSTETGTEEFNSTSETPLQSTSPTDVSPTSPPALKLQAEYSLADCARNTSLSEEQLRQWISAIEHKGQAILYGPPGTGKTFLAEHLARHLIGGGYGFTELVQFHPAYSYEEFMQGI